MEPKARARQCLRAACDDAPHAELLLFWLSVQNVNNSLICDGFPSNIFFFKKKKHFCFEMFFGPGSVHLFKYQLFSNVLSVQICKHHLFCEGFWPRRTPENGMDPLSSPSRQSLFGTPIPESWKFLRRFIEQSFKILGVFLEDCWKIPGRFQEILLKG